MCDDIGITLIYYYQSQTLVYRSLLNNNTTMLSNNYAIWNRNTFKKHNLILYNSNNSKSPFNFDVRLNDYCYIYILPYIIFGNNIDRK